MANLFVVCVKDTALDAFERPFFVPAIGLAIRHFGDEISNDKSPMFLHPEDYFLFSLGTFDTDSGLFVSEIPKQVARGVDFIKVPV